jgi:hypothetical protein
MVETIAEGTWVEVHRTVLPAGERAPQVPEDTQAVPLEMRAKGWLAGPARVGDEAEVVTAAGRRLKGILTEGNPAYSHSFGPPIPELLEVGNELRVMLRDRGGGR